MRDSGLGADAAVRWVLITAFRPGDLRPTMSAAFDRLRHLLRTHASAAVQTGWLLGRVACLALCAVMLILWAVGPFANGPRASRDPRYDSDRVYFRGFNYLLTFVLASHVSRFIAASRGSVGAGLQHCIPASPSTRPALSRRGNAPPSSTLVGRGRHPWQSRVQLRAAARSARRSGRDGPPEIADRLGDSCSVIVRVSGG